MSSNAVLIERGVDGGRQGFTPVVCPSPDILRIDLALPWQEMLTMTRCSLVDEKIREEHFKVDKKESDLRQVWEWRLFTPPQEFFIIDAETIIKESGGVDWQGAGTAHHFAFAAQTESYIQDAIIISPASLTTISLPGRPTSAFGREPTIARSTAVEKHSRLKTLIAQSANPEVDKIMRELGEALEKIQGPVPLEEQEFEPSVSEYFVLQFMGTGPVRRLAAPMARGKFPKSFKILGVRRVS